MSRMLSALVVSVIAVAALALAGAARADGGPVPSSFPTPIVGKPDLAVTAATSTGFTVKNFACNPLLVSCFPRGGPSGSFWVLVRWDAGVFGTRSSLILLGSLAEGASTTINYAAVGLTPYLQPCGSLIVAADALGQVDERNESNNIASTSLGSYLNCV